MIILQPKDLQTSPLSLELALEGGSTTVPRKPEVVINPQTSGTCHLVNGRSSLLLILEHGSVHPGLTTGVSSRMEHLAGRPACHHHSLLWPACFLQPLLSSGFLDLLKSCRLDFGVGILTAPYPQKCWCADTVCGAHTHVKGPLLQVTCWPRPSSRDGGQPQRPAVTMGPAPGRQEHRGRLHGS